jgi:hypothetical protein
MLYSWYSIHILEDELTIFEGYFIVNSLNIIVGFYETINGTTNYDKSLLIRGDINSTDPSEYLGFQVYQYIFNNNKKIKFDNAYLPSWKQFDVYGVVIKSMSKKPEVTSYLNLSASYIGDETKTNNGQLIWMNENTFEGGNCSFTIIPVLPQSDICFPKGTPILTDQGTIPIDKLTVNNTIDHKKIVGITQTVTDDKYLIRFKHNALGNNIPSKETIMTKDHKIFYQGTLIKSNDFANTFPGVTTVKYSGETLYNVLMEDHYKMNVNNIICETLNPTSEMAKIYTYITLHPKYMVKMIETYNKEYMKRKKPKLIFK